MLRAKGGRAKGTFPGNFSLGVLRIPLLAEFIFQFIETIVKESRPGFNMNSHACNAWTSVFGSLSAEALFRRKGTGNCENRSADFQE
ncbi:MAG: hypothetical protein JXR87_05485 [Candidatus Marinimicrobia bacterium]|nr:hypothetical protein [Candidatus Neomarinimicrobiota bacterium]